MGFRRQTDVTRLRLRRLPYDGLHLATCYFLENTKYEMNLGNLCEHYFNLLRLFLCHYL